ncbi:MmgE/PrpD family protein [Halomarina ordinaria]|uniref:MmgE/PrpD family protein n=1 Tax=Halomarina ordinaria TaxID=3033939 RepID=A0ABD5UIC7_9EURY|nr:MmgE/PrpD family protein [Halomarina sp. PSRA2]
MTRALPEPVADWEASVFTFLETSPPERVLDHGGRTVADVLAATVAGSAAPPYCETWTAVDLPPGTATVLGTDRTTAPAQAASLNGTAAIVQEVEEGHNTGGHVGSGIVTGGLAMAETADASGARFVKACVKAYEVCARLEEAIFRMKARINDAVPWLVRNPHATWTVVGPALAGVLAAGGDEAAVREAFRLAANRAVVSMDDPYAAGPPSRNLTAGASAAVGVLLAQQALAGMTGSESAVRAVYDPFDEDEPGWLTDRFADLGVRWEVTYNYFKPYPSCRYTHPPLDALRDISLPTSVAPDDVDRIVVETYANAVDMARRNPETLTGAKFSIPYVLARYLRSGEVTLEHFDPERIAEPSVRALADRVEVRVDDEFEVSFPDDWGARVTVELTDGRRHSAKRAYPRGDFRDPVDDEAFDERLQALLAWGLPESRVDGGFHALTNIRGRSARSVAAALASR